MLASILGVLILAAVFILFLANASAGAYASLIAILFAPYIQVSSGLSFRIEHLLLPLILLALCIRSYRTGRPLACPRLAALYALWWLISLVSTLCSAAGGEVTVEWLGAYGYLRPALIILVFANVFPDANRYFRRLLLVFIISAIPLAALAIGQALGVGFLRELTDQFFTSPGRPVMGNQVALEAMGFAFRALSVFENVSFAGTYFLLVIFTGILVLNEPALLSDRSKRPAVIVAVCMAVLGGLFTLSATFIGGAFIVLILLFFGLGRAYKKRILAITAGLFVLLAVALTVVPADNDILALVSYQVTKVTSFSGIADRYDSSSGQTADAIQATNERPLIGWGFVTKSDVVVNDSLYVAIYYAGGLAGVCVFAYFLFHLAFLAGGSGPYRRVLLIWLAIMLISGVSCASMYVPRIGDWWWALAGLAYRTYPVQTEAVPVARRRGRGLSLFGRASLEGGS